MDILAKLSGQAWVAVGDQANWELGIGNGIWGVVPELETHWNKIGQNDLILFYCKTPIKRVFGAGVVRSKFKQTLPLWKEEIEAQRCIWPFRFEFDILHLLPFGAWHKLGINAREHHLAIMAGINSVDFAKAIEVYTLLFGKTEGKLIPKEEVRSFLYEIGNMQRMIVEKDYPIDRFTLDVVWKRLIRSVPTFSFCIDLQGTFQISLQTLKHAYDIWNTRPFLVTEEGKIEKAKETTNGLYHELGPQLKILSVQQVRELYSKKKNYFDLEEQYGLR